MVFIDVLKVFAIFCVVWGHTPGISHNLSMPNYVGIFTYSFHMPLFYFLSGFFFISSLKMNFKDFIIKKSIQLLLPWLVWCILLGIGWNVLFNRQLFKLGFLNILKEIFYSNSGSNSWFWFLRELFISYLITYTCYKILKKWILVAIVGCFLVYIAPFDYFWRDQRVFLPYFMAGIILKGNYEYILKYIKQILLVSVLLYLAWLPFWGIGYMTTPEVFSWGKLSLDFHDLKKTLYIFIIMLCRIMLLFSIFYYAFNNNKKITIVLASIGKFTLVIYIIQVIIIEHVLHLFHGYSNTNAIVFQFIITPCIAALTIIFSMFFYYTVHKWKYLELILFGNSYLKK